MDSENRDELTEPSKADKTAGEDDGESPKEAAGSGAIDGSPTAEPVTKPDPAAEVSEPVTAEAAQLPEPEVASEPAGAQREDFSAPVEGSASLGEAQDTDAGVAVNPDESEAVAVIGAGGEFANITEEPTPAASGGEISDLAPQRESVVSELFRTERPRPSRALELTAPYAEAVAGAVTAGLSLGDEVAALATCVAEANSAALEDERGKEKAAVERGREHIQTYEMVFEKLAGLAENVASEVEGLNEEDEAFQTAPEEVQAFLQNHKKGVEIIQRMIDRTIQQKKSLEESPPRLVAGLPQIGRPASPEEFAGHVSELCIAFHDIRDGNYHILQSVEKECEKCHDHTMQTVRGLLSVVDGIDSGLEYEADSREMVPVGESGSEDLACLVSAWFRVYERLMGHLETFLEAAGIEPQIAERGTPFNPDHMEPIGTISDPDLEDETVAKVSRRGFVMNGEMVRPISVDVVRNDR